MSFCSGGLESQAESHSAAVDLVEYSSFHLLFFFPLHSAPRRVCPEQVTSVRSKWGGEEPGSLASCGDQISCHRIVRTVEILGSPSSPTIWVNSSTILRVFRDGGSHRNLTSSSPCLESLSSPVLTPETVQTLETESKGPERPTGGGWRIPQAAT